MRKKYLKDKSLMANDYWLKTIQKGQAMLLTVILLSVGILGSTSLVGILMVYEIRQAADIESSAQALFAADAGIECAAYKHYKDSSRICGDVNSPVVLDNGAHYRVRFIPVGLETVAQSVGQSRRTARAFSLEL